MFHSYVGLPEGTSSQTCFFKLQLCKKVWEMFRCGRLIHDPSPCPIGRIIATVRPKGPRLVCGWMCYLPRKKRSTWCVFVCMCLCMFMYLYIYIYILNVSCGIMSLHFDWSVLTRCRMSHRSRELPWPTTCCSRSQESHGLHEQSKGHQFLPKRQCKPCTRR